MPSLLIPALVFLQIIYRWFQLVQFIRLLAPPRGPGDSRKRTNFSRRISRRKEIFQSKDNVNVMRPTVIYPMRAQHFGTQWVIDEYLLLLNEVYLLNVLPVSSQRVCADGYVSRLSATLRTQTMS
ncbi:hypothetical protein J6590_028199 [Homalodisca vitripennis]|nr:hypothetical protein J6590_028199 [Homalodisca vitripennis]